MQLITLAEFRRNLALSERSTIWLLEHNSLALHLDSERGLMIDIEALDTRTLIKGIAARKRLILDTARNELVNRLGVLLTENLDSILDEAVSLATASHDSQLLTCQGKGKTGQ